ncbi:MAG: protein kinase [bacterium]
MIGTTIAHYKIMERIGAGGMGVVYKAYDTRLKRYVALKFLPPELTRDTEAKERFIREAQAASALQHDNICTIHDIDETSDGQLYICMDLYEGETLKKKIERGPLPIGEAIDIALQTAKGLQRAHSTAMIHRDIKPANIMLTKEGKVKIVDFGLAKLAERKRLTNERSTQTDAGLEATAKHAIVGQVGLRGQTKLTKTGSTPGTIAYMSPEQAIGEKLDQRSDIWSLGVVLYEMITGQLPFKSESYDAVVYYILNEIPQPVTTLRKDVPQKLEKIIEKCLEKKVSDRYQKIDELIADLQRATKATITKKRLKIGLSTVTVVLLALVGLYFLLPLKTNVRNKSIAVLPFQNLSPGGPHAYFAGGLHDELLTQLSKVSALTVISRTSVMSYEGMKTPLRQIASELGVASVVEGSVQVVDGRLRVNVQLIDATTDVHLWAERYDRTLDDAFAIQSEVAQRIVAAVGGALTSTEQERITSIPTANAEAYRFYLQGCEYYARPGYVKENMDIAQHMFERALALDSGFALAHAALSVVHSRKYFLRADPTPLRATRMREEAEATLRLAPDLPQAHIAMGRVHYAHRDWRKALEEFTIALKGLPNDGTLWSAIGYAQRRLGNWNEALAAFEKATLIAPRDADLFWDLGAYTYKAMHRYAEAVRLCDHALSLAPDLNGIAIMKGWIYVAWKGQFDTLRVALDHMPMNSTFKKSSHAMLLYWERQADSLLSFLSLSRDKVIVMQSSYLPNSLFVGWAHQLRGDRPAAMAAFKLSLGIVDSMLRELPEDWRVHAGRGLTLAGLGRQEEARREAHWLQQSEPYRRDFFEEGFWVAEQRAQILAQIGDAEGALDEIERLVAGPSYSSVHTLRLDPLWDPIREHPRYKSLLVKYVER